MKSPQSSSITIAIPAIPVREKLLARAMESAFAQTLPPAGVNVAMDHRHEGAAVTRQRALDSVDTPWVAFLDDDDELKPNHLEELYAFAQETGADYVFSWYEIKDANGNVTPWCPLGHFGKVWDPQVPRQTTITTLVRTELAKEVGFLGPLDGDQVDGQVWAEDFQFTIGCNRLGRIEHLPARTWYWYHHGHNTSGRGDRW